MRASLFTLLLVTCGLLLQAQHKQTRKVDENFLGVETRGSIDLIVKQGNTVSIEIESKDKEILDAIETTVRGDKLIIRFKQGFRCYDCPTVQAYITAPTIEALGTSGSGNIRVEGTIKSKSLTLAISGSGDVEANSETQRLSCSTSGSGNMHLLGTTSDLDISISGSGDVRGYDLKCNRVDARVAGSGTIYISAEEELRASVAGSGDIYYRGNARVTNLSVAGSGSIRRQ